MARGMLLAAMLLAISATDVLGQPTAADNTLLKYMMNNKFAADPAKTAPCFGYFLPILNSIAEAFSKDYQGCTVDEQNKLNALNDEANKLKYQLEIAADDICVRLEACSNNKTALQFFDCYGGEAKKDTKLFYGISQNSTEIAANLREDIYLAEVNRSRCQNSSERAYVEGSTKTYEQLDLCLQTGDVPTSSTTGDISSTEILTTTTYTTTEIPTSTANVRIVQHPNLTNPVTEAEKQQALPIEGDSSLLSKIQSLWKKT